MAVSDYINSTTVTPTPTGRTYSAPLGQVEHQKYDRVDRVTKGAILDLRDDVDQALQRLGSQYAIDLDESTNLPLGPRLVDGHVDPTSATNTVVVYGEYRAEDGLTAPVVSSLTSGTGASEVIFTARNPGNGSEDFPNGNRIIVFLRDPAANLSALAITTDLVEINGETYRCIDISLQTDGAGAILTTPNDLIDASDPTNVAYDADLGKWIEVTTGAGGAGVIVAMSAPQQLTGGSGGHYQVFLGAGSGTGGLVWHGALSWDADQVNLFNIDGTGYTDGDTVQCVVVANGMAYPTSILVGGGVASEHTLDGASHTAGSTPLAFVRTDAAGTGIEEVVSDSAAATASTVAVRNAAGGIKAADPVDAQDTATKHWIEDLGHGYAIFNETIDYTDISAAALTNAYALTGFPANVEVSDAWGEVVAGFDDGSGGVSLTAITVKIGDAGTDDELMADQSCYLGVSGRIYEDGLAALNEKNSAYAPLATFTAVGANLDTLTVGEAIISIRFRYMPIS